MTCCVLYWFLGWPGRLSIMCHITVNIEILLFLSLSPSTFHLSSLYPPLPFLPSPPEVPYEEDTDTDTEPSSLFPPATTSRDLRYCWKNSDLSSSSAVSHWLRSLRWCLGPGPSLSGHLYTLCHITTWKQTLIILSLSIVFSYIERVCY